MRSFTTRILRPRYIIPCLFLVALGLLAAWGIPQIALLQAPSCGDLVLPFGSLQEQQFAANFEGHRVKGIEQCFVQAYHQCKVMSLMVTEHGVDTGTHYTYSIKPNGSSCQITESAQNYSANFGGSQGPVMTTTCQGLTENIDALVIVQCQGRDVTIPRGEDCGTVYQQATPAAVKFAEDCFAEDYQQCYPALLYYETSNEAVNEFRLNSSCQLTLVQQGNPSGTPCASLTQQADGLHMISCGKQGDILVPAKP